MFFFVKSQNENLMTEDNDSLFLFLKIPPAFHVKDQIKIKKVVVILPVQNLRKSLIFVTRVIYGK